MRRLIALDVRQLRSTARSPRMRRTSPFPRASQGRRRWKPPWQIYTNTPGRRGPVPGGRGCPESILPKISFFHGSGLWRRRKSLGYVRCSVVVAGFLSLRRNSVRGGRRQRPFRTEPRRARNFSFSRARPRPHPGPLAVPIRRDKWPAERSNLIPATLLPTGEIVEGRPAAAAMKPASHRDRTFWSPDFQQVHRPSARAHRSDTPALSAPTSATPSSNRNLFAKSRVGAEGRAVFLRRTCWPVLFRLLTTGTWAPLTPWLLHEGEGGPHFKQTPPEVRCVAGHYMAGPWSDGPPCGSQAAVIRRRTAGVGSTARRRTPVCWCSAGRRQPLRMANPAGPGRWLRRLESRDPAPAASPSSPGPAAGRPCRARRRSACRLGVTTSDVLNGERPKPTAPALGPFPEILNPPARALGGWVRTRRSLFGTTGPGFPGRDPPALEAGPPRPRSWPSACNRRAYRLHLSRQRPGSTELVAAGFSPETSRSAGDWHLSAVHVAGPRPLKSIFEKSVTGSPRDRRSPALLFRTTMPPRLTPALLSKTSVPGPE